MKTIVILMDTLNRHMLKCYNPEAKAITPAIDRLAAKSIVFDNHFIGSAPCMPARRDILTGRLNFLERNWGPIEPFDVTFPELLRKQGTFCHIVTDHSHYAEIGGEGYMQQFNTWDLQRGQETDVWASRIKEPDNIPEQYFGRMGRQYQCNRMHFQTDADYPTPRTFASAAKWLEENGGEDDFFLMVEAFDPHEPFDATEEFKAMYPEDYDGPVYEWPKYAPITEETPEAVNHLRNLYYATLSMADKWLGKLLDEMDRQNLWEDTMVIFTSDHGHMLGEHGVTGKNQFHAWNEMSHIPLFVHLPGGKGAGTRCNAVTQNVDLCPTMLDYYGVTEYPPVMPKLHGKSWKPLLDGETEKVRDYAIYGWHGKPVNITDGQYTYFRAAKDDSNAPLYSYMSMLTTFPRYMGRDVPKGALVCGDYLPHAQMAVYRLDMAEVMKHLPPFMRDNSLIKDSLLFDLATDYAQEKPLQDPALEQRMTEALIRTMEEHDSPAEQFERLGLK
ncbi:sulfatase-like hydrolase/transferase [Ruminococcaceae bacterium OttesenSCG-928-L11]|nr:sulfatase-like hydrolase/transferase [Ruminococcaceae bacterium OttesenSCG-928-L11]